MIKIKNSILHSLIMNLLFLLQKISKTPTCSIYVLRMAFLLTLWDQLAQANQY